MMVATSSQPAVSEPQLIIILGLGDGAALRAVQANPHVQDILVYEPGGVNFETQDPRVCLVRGVGVEVSVALKQYFASHPFALTRVFNCEHVVSPPTEVIPGRVQLYEDFIKLFHAAISDKLEHLQPNEEDAFWGLMNTVSNFPSLWQVPHIDQFKDIFFGQTGVLVGTGPSLEHALPLLKAKRAQVVICACDSALKVLLANGIVPDAVVSIERLGQTAFLFEGMSELPCVPLIVPAIMSPSALAMYRGPKIRISLSHGFDDWLDNQTPVDFMVNIPSVSHLAYVVLRKFGCDRIFLLGQDLSHDPFSERSHIAAAAAYIHEAEQDLITTGDPNSQIFAAAGIDGKPRRTNFYWQHFAEAFGLMIAHYGGTAWNVLPTSYGIPIPGAAHFDPHVAFASLTEVSINRQILPDRLALEKNSLTETSLSRIVTRLKHEQSVLDQGSQRSLAAMRMLGAFWMDHNPMLRNRGYEKLYEVFFSELETQLETVFAGDDDFWLGRFRRLILNSFLGLRVERAQLQHSGEQTYVTLNNLIQVYYKTFNLIQLWAARSSELISHHLLSGHNR